MRITIIQTLTRRLEAEIPDGLDAYEVGDAAMEITGTEEFRRTEEMVSMQVVGPDDHVICEQEW
jgi:hypothetical protein